jgi:CRISPR-associated protein Cas1
VGVLYLDQADTELRYRQGAIELRRDGTLLRTLPGALITRVVLRADTRLSSHTLAALADDGIGVVVLGGRNGQRVAHVLGKPHNDARIRIAQLLNHQDPARAGHWCSVLVGAKVRRQWRLLSHAIQHRPDLHLPLTQACQTLQSIVNSVQACREPGTLRGLEGAAAAAYFRAYAQLFAASLHFGGRQRRPPPDPVNATLSLGYTLLYSAAVQACWVAGLDPMVGFLHQPTHGRASMASDLMEPWRPTVDAWVWDQFRQRYLRPDHFGRDGAGACLMGKAARAHFYAAFTPVQKMCSRAMQRHARQLARALLRDAPQWPDAAPTDEP